MAIDADKLHDFLGKGVVDFGAVFHAAAVLIGDRLGLYKKLAPAGPMTSTSWHRRPVQRSAMSASGSARSWRAAM